MRQERGRYPLVVAEEVALGDRVLGEEDPVGAAETNPGDT
jgi:hypothetical protein